jgi:hypothetical protein
MVTFLDAPMPLISFGQLMQEVQLFRTSLTCLGDAFSNESRS